MRERVDLVIVETLRLPVRWVRTRLSSMSLGSDGASIRNFPGHGRRFSLDNVDRFDWETVPDGRACVLILRDGSHTRVWGVDENNPGATAVLNNKLLEFRASGIGGAEFKR
jgi:hypothetical protein